MYCKYCGVEIYDNTVVCPKCGAVVNPEKINEALSAVSHNRTKKKKDKTVAAILALLLGGFGVHRFYLGDWRGIFYLLFIWTFIPHIVGVVEGILFLLWDEEKFDKKYNC